MESIVHFFVAGGWVMYPLLVLSIVCLTIIAERILAYRTLANVPLAVADRITTLARGSQFAEALELCKKAPGPMAACLAAALEARDQDVAGMERQVQEVGEREFVKLERYLPILDTTTTISPLLGLLGTLFGMIRTFQAIAAAKSQGVNDSILNGVGEALYATATGLSIAVICFIAYNYFAARTRYTISETEAISTRLINVLAQRTAREKEVARA